MYDENLKRLANLLEKSNKKLEELIVVKSLINSLIQANAEIVADESKPYEMHLMAKGGLDTLYILAKEMHKYDDDEDEA